MSLIRMAFELLMPDRQNNKTDHHAFGRRNAKADETRSSQFRKSGNRQFGQKVSDRKFKMRGGSRRDAVTLSTHQRELNRQQWERNTPAKVTEHRCVTVMKKERESDDMVSLDLSLNDGRKLDFKAGQFLTCHFALPGAETIRRAYSIACSPSSGNLRLAIKKLPNGVVSQFVHSQLKQGYQFEVSGPSGDFTLQDAAATRVFIAGGSGITPIKSQIDTLLDSGADLPIILIYANRRQRTIAFNKHFSLLSKKHANLKVIHVLSQATASWKGLRGRLNQSALETLLMKLVSESLPSARFYLCGPDGLIEMAQETLKEQGVPSEHIKQERFLAAASATRKHPEAAHAIRFTRSQCEVKARPGESLLEAGLRAGVPLKSSCQVGGCGHCKVSVCSGDVSSDEPNCLSAEEFRQGYRLACLSYANSATEVDA